MLASVFILCWTPPHSCHCHCCCCCCLGPRGNYKYIFILLISTYLFYQLTYVNVCACAVFVNVRATQSLAHRLIRFSPVHYSFRVFPCVVYTYVFTINFSSVCRAADATYITKVPMTINHIVNMLSPSSTSPSPRPLLHAALLARATYRAVYYRFSFIVFIVYCLSFIVWRLTDCTLCDVGWASAGYPSPTWWATSLRALGHVRPRLLSPHSLISVVEPLMTSYRRWPLHWHQHVPSLTSTWAL